MAQGPESMDLVQRAWRNEGIGGRMVRLALRPAASLYATAVRLRALGYRLRLRRRKRLPAGVVSVGNLTVGGTGKTPTALWVAERLRERGYRVAILSRGYGGTARKPKLVDPSAPGEWRLVGDESVLLARRFAGPVIVARRRAKAGELACREQGADVVVLDDGFQHLKLARDFDLVCIRARSLDDPVTLPAGRFREPASALRRADAVLVTKGAEPGGTTGVVRRLKRLPLFHGNLRVVSLVTHGPQGWYELPLGRLASRRALVVTGIADREPFYQTLHDWEARTEDFLEFPDHHPYDHEDWKKISFRSRELELVVTTEKDLVKLEHFPFAKEKLVAVRVSMEVEDGERLMDAVEERLPAPVRERVRGLRAAEETGS